MEPEAEALMRWKQLAARCERNRNDPEGVPAHHPLHTSLGGPEADGVVIAPAFQFPRQLLPTRPVRP